MTERRSEFQRSRADIVRHFGRKTLICARCGHKSKSTHLHHIHPLIEGGSDSCENLIPLCGDCHDEWDIYADAGIDFGNYLTTLSAKTFAVMYRVSAFRFPTESGFDMSKIYILQFTGNAMKQEEPLDYFEEIRQENAVFCQYQYSDTNEMLRLYGTHYDVVDVDGANELAEESKRLGMIAMAIKTGTF